MNIRDEFHFSDIHRSMNAMGSIQNGVAYFARDPLCSYFDECQKNDIDFAGDPLCSYFDECQKMTFIS